ncbi:hypothetical protein OXV40_29260 [Burkholderia contaminans]|uniref:Uncharacterized protein n=1 Tax=Burkholderia contaminans TaxID=488447 RepID=A0ABD7YGI4_9BURK|nr:MULTISPECIES: hypothetical protein [Burkholderia cepacia complex]UTP27805.1 hypothetical protein NMB33_40680 [Burkholderia sp. FXe9]HBN6128331.1 hypothetical protein [Clostridioides difficile]MBA9833425.1 hypothetical protein [Burkholderia contaminans]MCA8192075.1 hypothetical protein [Burkholderia contaminans]MCQ4564406.1 hypothetical protein [Burkholderia contaminans]
MGKKATTGESGLPDGRYMAKCRERNAIAAGMNGHSLVWPTAILRVANGIAIFERDGVKVWSCNAMYAATHFEIEDV